MDNCLLDLTLFPKSLVIVVVALIGGHESAQKPQNPPPPTCTKFSSTFVEHQYFPSGSNSVMQASLNLPSNLNGRAQGAYVPFCAMLSWVV